MTLFKYYTVRKRSCQEDLGEDSSVKRGRNDSEEPAGEEDSAEEVSESEAESSSITTAADTSTTETSTTETSSGSKQATRFSRKWLKGREHWLHYVKGQGMFCKLCKKYDQRSFGHDIWNKTACKCLRLQSITSHETSSAHRESAIWISVTE